MSELPSTAASDPDAAASHNLPTFSVSEISHALKRSIESSFGRVRVKGEISGFKRAASGHCYFSLKDADAVLDSVCWRGTAIQLNVKPEDGMEVVAVGRLTTYPGRSKYQMVVEAIELAGEGALLKLLEERRKKLAAEGLFDAVRKRPLPYLPRVIGVVTSPTGAVIRDILHRIGERFPRHVILWPVVVQGEGAAQQVAAAIEGFNRLEEGGRVPRPDLLIVARGGGSLEDLWAFNEEIVVRAAASSKIPLISAVGHETDVTLIDFAADHRAPTPTAAAEKAVPVRMDLLSDVLEHGVRLVSCVNRYLEDGRSRIEGLARGLPNLRRLVEEETQRLDDWTDRLRNSLGVGVERRRGQLKALAAGLTSPKRLIEHGRSRLVSETRALDRSVKGLLKSLAARFDQARSLLESFSYERVLERGFVLVHDDRGALVASAAEARAGMALDLRFHDGHAAATVNGTAPAAGGRGDSGAASGERPKKDPKPKDSRQGKLL